MEGRWGMWKATTQLLRREREGEGERNADQKRVEVSTKMRYMRRLSPSSPHLEGYMSWKDWWRLLMELDMAQSMGLCGIGRRERGLHLEIGMT